MIFRICCMGLLALFFCSGCTAKKELLNEIDTKTESYGNSMLCGQIQGIQVIDKRDGVAYDVLDIPTISWPGQKDEIRPPLTPIQEQLILDEISNRSLESGNLYTISIHILEGVQRFEATWRSEREYVNWNIEMLLQSSEGTASATSETEYFARSIDASHGYIDELYIKTLRLGVLSAFSKAMTQLPGYYNDANCS